LFKVATGAELTADEAKAEEDAMQGSCREYRNKRFRYLQARASLHGCSPEEEAELSALRQFPADEHLRELAYRADLDPSALSSSEQAELCASRTGRAG
jgi:hypothetical protein